MKIGRSVTSTSNSSDSSDRKIPPELHLLDDVQTKTDEGYNQSESLKDLRKLSNDNITAIHTDDVESDGEITSNNESIAELLVKIKGIIDKIEDQLVENDILTDEWEIFRDFFNLIDKNVTDKDLTILERGLKQFFHAIYTIIFRRVLSQNSDYAKKVFYMYVNLMNSTVVQNYLKNVSMSDRLKLFYCNCIKRILQVMCEAGTRTGLTLNDDQRPMNYIEPLSLMLNYVKKDLESSDLTIDASVVRSPILQFIRFYSDKTILIPDMVEAGGLEIIMEGLSTINKTADVHSDLKQQLISIVYNISRHDDGSRQLKALNAVNEIKLFKTNNNNTDLDNLCCMALPLLTAPDRIKYNRKRMNDVLDKLLQLVYGASVSYRYRDSNGVHISEPLVVLAKLFNNARSLDYIMEYSQVDLKTSTNVQFFINLLIKYYTSVSDEDPLQQPTWAALVNILWRVSFEDNYKEILKNVDTSFQELIQNLTEEPDENIASSQYVPNDIANIQKTAQELLININTSSQPASEQTNELSLQSTTTTEETFHPKKSIEQWNKNDISQWFQNNGIRTELCDLCRFQDGDELLNYARIFLDTEKIQYQMYSKEFSRRNGITSGQSPLLLHEFTEFSTALQKLENSNQ